MSRYGFNVGDVEIVVGWDNPTQTFFGQTEVDGESVIDTMIGMGRFDIKCTYALEQAIGFSIPNEIQMKLIEDVANAQPQTPLQATVSKMRKEML